MTRRHFAAAGAVAAGIWMVTCTYGVYRPLPDGVSTAGPLHSSPDTEFLFDLTYQRAGLPVVEQRIFDRLFRMIDEAEEFVVLDMFLFNGEHAGDREYLPLSERLTERLAEKRAAAPSMPIHLTTDEINNFYGAYESPQLTRLRSSGVSVAITDLTKLRDSNPLYSAVWRALIRWFGTGGTGFLPHPLTSRGQRVTARSYLKLFNLKANHRKLIVTERGCLITSANPHDASSFHSNIAFVTTGPVCGDMLASERAVAAFSGSDLPYRASPRSDARTRTPRALGAPRMQFLSERRIRESLLEVIAAAGPGDSIDVAMFYFSDRGVVRALLEASSRGTAIRVVLDPNKDAFGRTKGGIPNRQVAHELTRRSNGEIAVRWYDTHGEQFHTKLVTITQGPTVTVFGGSANLTRRNLRDYNLEADVRLVAERDTEVMRDVKRYIDRIWHNRDGEYTVPYEAYRDEGLVKRLLYRFQEFTGFCSY